MKLYNEVDIKLISKPDEIYSIIGIYDYSDNILKAAFGCKDVKVDNYMFKLGDTYLTGNVKLIFDCDVDLEKRKVVKYRLKHVNSNGLNGWFDVLEEFDNDVVKGNQLARYNIHSINIDTPEAEEYIADTLDIYYKYGEINSVMFDVVLTEKEFCI